MKPTRHSYFFLCFLVLLAILPYSVAAQDNCLPARLEAGGQGMVLPGAANRIRALPSTSGEQVGQIPGGAVFDVLEGPTCDGGFLWWRVSYQGTEGWTVEGNASEYFVEPVIPDDSEAPATPTPAAPSACAMEPRLQIGREGRTTSSTPSRLRDNPGVSGQQVGQIDSLDVFTIVDGPVCADGIYWWQVEVDGATGWTAEGVDGDYLVEMLEIVPTATPVYIGLPEARAIDWSADGTRIAVGTHDGVYVYDAGNFTQPPTRFLEGYRIDYLAFDPQVVNRIALKRDDGEIYAAFLYDVETGEELHQFFYERPMGLLNSLAFSDDGAKLALNDAGNLTILNPDTREYVHSIAPRDYTGGAAAYLGAIHMMISPDGQWLAMDDGRVMIFPADGEYADGVVLDRDVIDDSVTSMAFSTDNQRLVVGDVAGNLQMWDVNTYRRTSFIRGQRSTTSNYIYALEFSPDGETLVTAEGDPQAVIRVFDAVSLTQVAAFSDARAEKARDLAFSPDGALLAAIFGDTVRILETEGYTQVAELVVRRN